MLVGDLNKKESLRTVQFLVSRIMQRYVISLKNNRGS